jgi:hypothetical protein
MMAKHLHLVDASNVTDARVAQIHKAFTAVWGDQVNPLEVTHRDALIDMGVTPERAQMEFTMRRLRRLREP